MPSSGSGGSHPIRRIQRELKEISEDPSRHWTASPVADDMFEWQFAVRGPPGTDFEGGVYTGRLVLPVNYPLAPPSIMLLTPNGRFEVGKKICLSNSSYHPELWQPAWGIRTMMEALRSHFPMPSEGAIGALDWPSDLRKQLAKESLDFVCPPSTSPNRDLLPELTIDEAREDLPEHGECFGTVAAANPMIATSPAASPIQEVGVAAVPQLAQSLAEPAPEDLPSGLRHRGSAPPAVAPSAMVSEPAQTQPAASASASASSAATEGSGTRRRQAEGSRSQRRAQPVLVQLLKPPRSRREWVLMLVDVLIFLATICFIVVLVDIIRNPPKLLNPLPEQRDPQN